MQDAAQRLLRVIRSHEFLRAGDRVAVAVSGGADSVALLFLLADLRAELGIVLSVAHVNHKLRGVESDGDETFTTGLAARLGLECEVAIAPIESPEGTGGPSAKPNVEAAARELRYSFFRKLAGLGRANKIVTAHTLDDQAETVLLRMFRGTGIRGLAGILPRLAAVGHTPPDPGGGGTDAGGGEKPDAEIIRPLLTFRRTELRNYLRGRAETWREDSSNSDPGFARNRVRQRLLPMIAEEFGDAAIARIADLAEIARAEEEYCASAVELDGPVSASLEVKELLALPLAMRRRLARAWLEANAPGIAVSFPLIEEVLELAAGPAGKRVQLPGATRSVRRGRGEVAIEKPGKTGSDHYEYALPVPGAVTIPELSARYEACIVDAAAAPEGEHDALLDPARVGELLTIRNWRPGDRYWPAHTAREKKVKDLLADLHVTGAKKKLWPVAVDRRDGLVWMHGFAVPETLRARGRKAVLIRGVLITS